MDSRVRRSSHVKRGDPACSCHSHVEGTVAPPVPVCERRVAPATCLQVASWSWAGVIGSWAGAIGSWAGAIRSLVCGDDGHEASDAHTHKKKQTHTQTHTDTHTRHTRDTTPQTLTSLRRIGGCDVERVALALRHSSEVREQLGGGGDGGKVKRCEDFLHGSFRESPGDVRTDSSSAAANSVREQKEALALPHKPGDKRLKRADKSRVGVRRTGRAAWPEGKWAGQR